MGQVIKALIGLFLLISPVNAQQSKTAISSQIANSSAAGLVGGTILNNIVNSYVDWLTCTGTGGIVYWNVGVPTCLNIGTNGQILNIASGKPAWLSVGTLSGVPLTSANDTNVTLTLGGSPTTALLNSTSITAGWIGTLAANRGGFGADISAQSGVPFFTTGVAAFTSTTGTGNFVRATSPSLVTPSLGIATAGSINKVAITAPAIGSTLTIADGKTFTVNNTLTLAGIDATTLTFQGTDTYIGRTTTDTLTNKSISGASNTVTNVPISTGISGLGTGVATALGINTGSAGAFVLFNGALGTPTSGTLTNATGLPISTGVSGLGTSVASTLAINLGTTGSIVTLNQNLGTPSAGVLTNATGLPLSTGVTGNLPDANMPNTAWTTFTPTVTCGTATFTTTSARAKTWGKVTHFELDATFTALGTCTAAVSFTLPNTTQSGAGGAGREQNSSGKGIGCAALPSSTTMFCSKGDATNWINGERLVVSGVYENQ